MNYFVIVVILLLCSIGGCGKKESEKLVICTDWSTYDEVKGAVSWWKTFNREYSTIQTEIIRIPSDKASAETKITELRTAIMAGKGPDLFILESNEPYNYTLNGEIHMLFPNPEKAMYSDVFLSLDDYLKDAEYIKTEDCNQVVLQAGQTEDGQMLLPIIYSYEVCFFPKKGDYGINRFPTSWEEISSSKSMGASMRTQLPFSLPYYFGQLADYENETLLITEEDLLKQFKTDLSDSKAWDNVAWAHMDNSFFRYIKERNKEPNTFYPVPNIDGGVTALISVYAGINQNTQLGNEAFSLLDTFCEMIKANEEFSNRGIFIAQDEILQKFYRLSWIQEEDITSFLEMNEKRLNETNSITAEALEQLKDTNISKQSAIVVYNDNWESGVLGIICSKLVEIYNRPVCVLTRVDDTYKGSIRSIPAVNVFEALNNIKEHLIQFGGHNQAAGITLKPEKLEDFKKAFNDYIFANYSSSDFVFAKNYDMDLSKVKVTQKFVGDLDKLEPFGLANEKPVFKLSFNGTLVKRLPKHFNHIKLSVNNIELIGFNMGDYVYNLSSNCNKHAIVELGLETFNKKTKIKGILRHLSFSELNTGVKTDLINASYLLQLNYFNETNSGNYKVVEPDEMFKLINKTTEFNSFGTLVIANTIESYKKFVENNKNISNFDLYKINNTYGENCIIFAPNTLKEFKNYSKIFLLDPPIHHGFINKLTSFDSEVYIPNKSLDLDIFKKLSVERDIFAKYHNAIKFGERKEIEGGDYFDYFNKLKDLNPQFALNMSQMVFVALVLSELKIINVEKYRLTFNQTRNELTNSNIYNFVCAIINSGRKK